MEEELICKSCSSTWKRTRLRGRKPLLCPACSSLQSHQLIANQSVKSFISQSSVTSSDLSVSKIHAQLHPKPANYQELQQSTKNGSTWKCPGCGYVLKMFISLIAPPTHRCTPDTVTLKVMQRID